MQEILPQHRGDIWYYYAKHLVETKRSQMQGEVRLRITSVACSSWLVPIQTASRYLSDLNPDTSTRLDNSAIHLSAAGN
jgi:hypothetical protein